MLEIRRKEAFKNIKFLIIIFKKYNNN